MNPRRILLAFVLVCSCAAFANRASAQYASNCGYGGFGGYGYWDIGRLYGVLAEKVPYYAAFPPVYYSVPVPRTYGYSPFAYPPGVMTPEVTIAQPLTIDNPFFKKGPKLAAPSQENSPAAGQGEANRTAATESPAPQTILNPFVRNGQARVHAAVYNP